MKISKLPYFTQNIDGIGGTIKSIPDDFVVEEIPAYIPEGEGTHLYLWIEKQNINSQEMSRIVANYFDVAARDIGMAGLKDKHAITRQWISVDMRHNPEINAATIIGPIDANIRILNAAMHTNKLRTGHLKGNRFQIVIRETFGDLAIVRQRIEAIAQKLQQYGMPNYYGAQRFGSNANNLSLGIALLNGDAAAKKRLSRRASLKRLVLSAVQSELFNAVAAYRMEQGILNQVIAGDIMQKRDTGGIFMVEKGQESDAQQRLENGEVGITGPMWGPKMRTAEMDAGQIENEILLKSGLTMEQFAQYKKLAQGTRRMLTVPIRDFDYQYIDCFEKDGQRTQNPQLSFSLESGSYATVLLREFMKND